MASMSRPRRDAEVEAARPARRPRVTILQEYIADYRVAMLRALRGECVRREIDLVIAAGAPREAQRKRGDIAADFDVEPITQREFSIRGRRLTLRQVGRFYRESDLVVVEQARRNLDLYAALADPRRAIALWGHGADMVEQKSPFERRLLRWLTRRAVWFFAYTDAGARALQRDGFPAERITVLKNATDTARLAEARDRITPEQVAAVRQQHGLTASTAMFVGALDPSKRLDFLVDAARAARRLDPDFRLVIVGDGPERANIATWAAADDTVKLVARATGADLALLASACRLMAMPGRVGLVAVDALVLGLPVVTTDWPWHAPEREYLDDSTSVVAPDDPEGFGRALVDLLHDEERLASLRAACLTQAPEYSAQAMAFRFAQGLEDALGRVGQDRS